MLITQNKSEFSFKRDFRNYFHLGRIFAVQDPFLFRRSKKQMPKAKTGKDPEYFQKNGKREGPCKA